MERARKERAREQVEEWEGDRVAGEPEEAEAAGTVEARPGSVCVRTVDSNGPIRPENLVMV